MGRAEGRIQEVDLAGFGAVFVHSGFVGMMTNLLLGVFSARTQNARRAIQSTEPAALWLMNLGLLIFFGLHIATGTRMGAIVMGVGVLLGVAIMIWRLLASAAEATVEAEIPAALE